MNKVSFKLKSFIKLAKAQKHNFASITTADGVVINYDTVTEGGDVWVEDAEGVITLPADGEYEIEGMMVTVKEGKMVTIVDPADPKEEEMSTEEEEAAAVVEEAVVEVEKAVEEGTVDSAQLQGLIDSVALLIEEVISQAEEMKSLKAKLSKSLATPLNEKEVNTGKVKSQFDLSAFGVK